MPLRFRGSRNGTRTGIPPAHHTGPSERERGGEGESTSHEGVAKKECRKHPNQPAFTCELVRRGGELRRCGRYKDRHRQATTQRGSGGGGGGPKAGSGAEGGVHNRRSSCSLPKIQRLVSSSERCSPLAASRPLVLCYQFGNCRTAWMSAARVSDSAAAALMVCNMCCTRFSCWRRAKASASAAVQRCIATP